MNYQMLSFLPSTLFKNYQIADDLDDDILKCFAISTLADHYARMRGFNETSTQLHLKAIDLAVEHQFDLANGMGDFRLGRYYYSFKKYPQAFEALLKAENILKKLVIRKTLHRENFCSFLPILTMKLVIMLKQNPILRNV